MGKVVCGRHKNNETGPLACGHVRSAIRERGPTLRLIRILASIIVDWETIDRGPLALCHACRQRQGLSGDSIAKFFGLPFLEDLAPVCRKCFGEHTTGWPA